MAKLTGAAKAAFLRKMAAGRRKAGGGTRKRKSSGGTRKRRKSGTRKRKSSGGALIVLPNRPPARARRNAPAGALKTVLAEGAAAFAGGLIAHVATKVIDRIASPGVADVARVAVPTLAGVLLTQIRHKRAQAAAAGAFGVAGAAIATTIADAIVKPNPPLDYWVDNPLQRGSPMGLPLMHAVNEGYRDRVTDLLLART